MNLYEINKNYYKFIYMLQLKLFVYKKIPQTPSMAPVVFVRSNPKIVIRLKNYTDIDFDNQGKSLIECHNNVYT